MSQYSPEDLKLALGSGLLSFPVTPTTDSYALHEAKYGEHIAWLNSFSPAGLFAAGGTGEFFSMTPQEISRVVRVAVAERTPGVPIVAPAGYGTALAVEQARDAEAAGADGVFLLPPYLTEVSQDGLVAHVKAVCAATTLGVVVYHRANAAFRAEAVMELGAACPNFIGFKDGIGDIELMARLYAELGDRLLYVGGLPTAEMYALPYLELGVTTYSSALYNFAPEFALDFYRAVREHDRAEVYTRLRDFVFPYLAIRNRKPGYAVSIVRAGMTIVGREPGPVRPPLTDLTAPERESLSALVNTIASVRV